MRFARVALLALLPARLMAQPPAAEAGTPVPFALGERFTYDLKFGKLKVGEGTMETLGLETIRGIEAWHTRFRVRGGVPFYRVDDVLESWFARDGLYSLRFVQDLEEGGKVRERRYEMFPERQAFREGDAPEQPSVAAPLDDGAFLYFVRTLPLEAGQTYSFDRYFRPDRNPVVIKVLGRETIKVPAGTFQTVVIQPVIKSKGIFSEKGEARIWLTDDAQRMMVQMKSKTKIGSLNLYLTSARHAPANATTR
ncbi:MAG: DUF3108 domain-containing protein [Gemmatimonadetes bacterium]|nr:DUF3108 domain-containing protein [Gemmatimonadota bacterium]